jgi:hypothetical protein
MMDDTLKRAITTEDQRIAMLYYSLYIDRLWIECSKERVSISYARNATAYACCLMMERFNAMGWKPETEFYKMMSGIDLQE